jgi:hypothetical protein
MSGQPEQPEVPDGGQSETVTTPAGATPSMFVPKHGKGRLYRGGVKGNVGGGRHPQVVLDKLILIGDQTCDELLLRLNDPKLRARMSADQLRLILGEVLPYFLARRFEHSGPEGGPIEFAAEDARRRLVKELQERLQQRPPGREPPTPPPEPRGVASAAL